MAWQGGIRIKKLFVIVSVIIMSVVLCSCSKVSFNDNSSVDDSIISFDLSTQYEMAYKIILDKKKNLHTYVYENQDDVYKSYKSVLLTQEQYDDIIKKIENLGKFDENSDSAVYDYWTVNLQINTNNYFFTYGLSANKNYDNLVEDIINLSSIEIVDSRGNDIKPFKE